VFWQRSANNWQIGWQLDQRQRSGSASQIIFIFSRDMAENRGRGNSVCRIIGCFICLALVTIGSILISPAPAAAADLASGEQVFQTHCEGCHVNGGNIIRRGKTLKLNALQRNGMDSLEAIAQIVTNGKNNMSAFRDRLTDEQIQDVAAYVLDRAETGWKKPQK
jgi:cytochrome c6